MIHGGGSGGSGGTRPCSVLKNIDATCRPLLAMKLSRVRCVVVGSVIDAVNLVRIPSATPTVAIMNAIPDTITYTDLQKIDACYQCPLCKTGRHDPHQKWVRCPLVGDNYICIGCCLDLQGLARAIDFEGDPFRGLFDEVSVVAKRSVVRLRRNCLEHQLEVVAINLKKNIGTKEQDDLLALAKRVSEILVQLDALGQ